MIKLIIFDFDGVLVDTEFPIAKIRTELLSQYGMEISLDQCLKFFTGLHNDTANKIIADEIGQDKLAAFIDEFNKRVEVCFQQNVAQIAYVDDMLAKITLPISIASNSDYDSLQLKLKVSKLDKYFPPESIFVASMVSEPKPAPDVYLLAAETYKVAPEACLVIEDSGVGITAALSANMQVIGFFGASHCYEGYEDKLSVAGAELLFDDMREVEKLLLSQ
ncbi:MAG: HAD family phosphatase [Rhizobiales bacterium]|nr:HAD family phosphatase [Hyphomicrobiales bacterium]NRB15863.1 HAD family phosphatase [Hyphomicrobiales bacterium]